MMINNNCRHGSRKKRGFLHYYYLKYRLYLQTCYKTFVERNKITKVLIVRFIRVFSYTCIVNVHDQDINPMMMYYKCSTILLFICLYLTSYKCLSLRLSTKTARRIGTQLLRGNIKANGNNLGKPSSLEVTNSNVFRANGKYTVGNLIPGARDGSLREKNEGFHNQQYWDKNPYFSYFKKVWGNAPFLDSNFRLWMSGAFKNFKVGSLPQKSQTTKALPAYLHYYGREYDPLVDPPYPSEEALYSDTKDYIQKISEAESKGSPESAEDCSQAFSPSALGYKRPCGVNNVPAGSYTKAKAEFQLNTILGKNTWWDSENRVAGDSQGTELYTYKTLPPDSKPYDEKQAKGKYHAVDNKWIKADDMVKRMKSPAYKPMMQPKPFVPLGFSHSKPAAPPKLQK